MHGTPRRLSDTLFSDIALPAETTALRQRVRSFCEAEMRPIADELNNTPEDVDRFPWQLVRTMADAGLFRIPFAASAGGNGFEFPTLATMVLLEEVAYFSSGAAAALIDVPLILFGHSITSARAPIRDDLLGQLMSGTIIGAFATSEPLSSTDLSPNAIQTIATRVDGGYRLTGTKRWITNSPVAHYMVVLAKLEDGLSLFLVDMSTLGVSVGAPDRKMGNYCQLTADVTFNDVFIPHDHLVGQEGSGLKLALTSLTRGRVGIGACGVGMAQAAFDYAASYMQQRHAFGRPLSALQYWQAKFAEHATEIENARSLYIKAALILDQGKSSVTAISAMAKLAGSRVAVDVARDAIQVCGGYGFVKEVAATGQRYPLEAIYRDSKIGEIYEGANEIQRLLIARSIFEPSNM